MTTTRLPTQPPAQPSSQPTASRPAVPAGVVRADDWSAAEPQYRLIAIRDRHVGHATVWADAQQRIDGSIVAPTVRLSAYMEDGLTPAQARQLAEELITAATEIQLLAATDGG